MYTGVRSGDAAAHAGDSVEALFRINSGSVKALLMLIIYRCIQVCVVEMLLRTQAILEVRARLAAKEEERKAAERKSAGIASIKAVLRRS
jgi:hypothetical protein